MTTPLAQMFSELASWGILDSLLPFMLIFAVVYAILQKARIFAKDKTHDPKNFNVIVALVMGLAVVIPHVMGVEPDVVNIINNALPQIALVVIALVMVFIILGIWGPTASWRGGVQGWMVLVSLGLVIYIFGSSAGIWKIPMFLAFLNNTQVQTIVVIFLVFAIIIWFITREDKDIKVNMEKPGAAIGKFFGLND